VITNYEEDRIEEIAVPNHPGKPEMGDRQVLLTRELWIERDDFMEDPPKKFFRLGPDRYVRLRGGYILKCTGYEKDAVGNVTEVRCEYLPGTIGNDAPEGVKCKAAIHWVSAEEGREAEVRLYDRLFSVEAPDEVEEGFISALNPDSLDVVKAWIEPLLADSAPESIYQFERVGYFVADRRDHVAGERLVFNRTVALRDSWGGKR
jgi:glutaminyl-tRNA synthetase